MSPGKGNQNAKGEQGNLLLKIKVKPHPKFMRQNLQIIIYEPITIAQAVLGTRIQV